MELGTAHDDWNSIDDHCDIIFTRFCEASDLKAFVRELEAAESRERALREALEEAADEIEGWGAYASEYMQDKHDLKGSVEKFRKLAALAAAGKNEGEGKE